LTHSSSTSVWSNCYRCMNDVVRYIIHWLCYGNEAAAEKVHYASSLDPKSAYPLTIIGDEMTATLHYPIRTEPQVEQLSNGHYVIHTDLVYNTFFFVSRAEEVLNPKRDEYDRFLACHSTFSIHQWQTALLDDYSHLILGLLNEPLPDSGFSAIHLTHDIDTLTQYRRMRGAVGGMLRGQWAAVWAALRDIHEDPAYTFPWMIQQDKGHEVIYFIKHTSGRGLDYPQYSLRSKDYLSTIHMLQQSGAQIGIHSSAYPTCPLPEGKVHRSHYLCCSIQRMQQLADASYTDDYTMGFADCAGFRLQTTRAVKWINPLTRQLTPLTLHPLTMMDCTLSSNRYMHLSEDEAYTYAARLIDYVRLHHGEVNLLWHNTSFNDANYHTTLYPKILQLL